MATHCSILARRIPWTEEPGGLQSMGCKESNMTEVTKHACKTNVKHLFPLYFPLGVLRFLILHLNL